MCDFLFSSTGRNSQVHSWPLAITVCLSRGAGGGVLDSSERSVTAQRIDTFKVGSMVKKKDKELHN